MLQRQQSEMDKLQAESRKIKPISDDLDESPYTVVKHLGEGFCSDVYLVEQQK